MSAATRAPRTLHAQCEQHANEVHSRRLAELAGLQPMLARLDEVVPMLKQHGLELHPDRIGLRRRFGGRTWQNTLRITCSWMHDAKSNAAWLRAFQAAGFHAIEVDPAGRAYPTAYLKRGHLVICVDVTCEDAATMRAALAPTEKVAA